MNELTGLMFQERRSSPRSAILRVYNYYRILVSFLFLYLFLDPNLGAFVGRTNPELFAITIYIYLGVNVFIGFVTLFVPVELISKAAPSFVILIADIIALTILMSASGGVSSGLGNFLIFTLAFGGVLILGRVSTVLPAIAFILTIYDEFYLFFKDESDLQGFFQAGILGIVYFASNILFQILSRQIRSRETEVYTLERINQLVIERMRTGVVVVSDDKLPRLINEAAEGFLKNPAEYLSPREQLPAPLLDRLVKWKHEEATNPAKFVVYDSGPELLATFSILNTPATNPDTLVFIEDSTEVQKRAQQLKLASLGQLSASIAHEIRNPLGAISHAAQLLSEAEDLSKGDQRLSEIIQNHCLRMNGVIENVLQMSRSKVADPKPILLGEWVEKFLKEFSAGVPGDVEIETDLKSSYNSIEIDPVHLSQVLGNLCQNGMRYSFKNIGKSKIRVVTGVDPVSRHPYLEVIDYGEGVKEELVHNLFEPFYTTEATGTGLGLYLSKELCEANNARLSYSKAFSGGSNFKITFLV